MTTLHRLRSFLPKSGSTSTTTRWVYPPSRALSARPQLHQEWSADSSSYVEPLRAFSLQSPQFEFRTRTNQPQQQPQPLVQKNKELLSLDSFIQEIPTALSARQLQQREQERDLAANPNAASSSSLLEDDPVLELFRNLKLTRSDWEPYAHFDPTRAYSRNLIYTDHKSFTLLLLCWNAAAESKIHDHPCDGCWLQVLQGQVQECRYEYPGGEDTTGTCTTELDCIADETFREGQVAFINDHIGLHKVGNPSLDIPAVTLHLYHPPFQDCRVWDDSSAGSSVSHSCCATHFSEYGQRIV